MKLLYFDDFKLGVLKGDAVVDVTAAVQGVPHTGPHDLINGVIGRFAVKHGRSEATKAAGRLQDQAAGVLDFLGDSVVGAPSRPSGARPAPTGPRAVAPRRATPAAGGHPNGAAPVPAASLAIPDYDGLSASQVVNRLAGLSPDELRSVQQYEAATRGRKTILSKVAQLQGG